MLMVWNTNIFHMIPTWTKLDSDTNLIFWRWTASIFSSWRVLHVDPEIHEFPDFVAQFASLLYQRIRYVPVTQLTSLEGEVFINWRSFSRRVTLPAVVFIRWHWNLDVIFKVKGCILSMPLYQKMTRGIQDGGYQLRGWSSHRIPAK